MEFLDVTAQKADDLVKKYKKSFIKSIYEIYSTVSEDKKTLLKEYTDMQEVLEGYDERIISFSSIMFVYAFMVDRGIHQHLVVMSPSHNYDINMEEYYEFKRINNI